MRLSDAQKSVRDLEFGTVDAEADRKLAQYFINTPQVDQALRFRSANFLGRKGSGKSAIFTQLPRLTAEKVPGAGCCEPHDTRSVRLGCAPGLSGAGPFQSRPTAMPGSSQLRSMLRQRCWMCPSEGLNENARKALERIRSFGPTILEVGRQHPQALQETS